MALCINVMKPDSELREVTRKCALSIGAFALATGILFPIWGLPYSIWPMTVIAWCCCVGFIWILALVAEILNRRR